MVQQSFKQKIELSNKEFFKWRQIINAIPREWKNLIETDNATVDPPKCQHLLHLTRVKPFDKLTAKFCYILKIIQIKEKPTSQRTILTKIGEDEIDWKNAYLNARKCTIDSYCRNFHYKCALNILSLNDSLSKIRKNNDHTQMISESDKCSYCKNAKETIIHLFKDCTHVKEVWNALKQKISINLPNLTPKSAFFVFFINDSMIVNK